MKTKSLYIVFASSLMLLVCFVYQGSFAYFEATIQGTGNSSNNTSGGVTDELKNLILTGGTNVGKSDMIPGDLVSYTFTLNNPNNIDICYNLKWSSVTNSFINQQDVVYSLKRATTSLASNIQYPAEGTSPYLISGESISSKTTESFTLTITYLNTSSNQIGDMGKSFSGKVIGEIGNCS